MKKKLQTAFQTRQYMLSKDFEIYYYNDHSLAEVKSHAHDYYEFYFFLEGDVSIQINSREYPVQWGDIILIPPHVSHRPIIYSQQAPYRRFVFWISRKYCEHLLDMSSSYAYLMQYVELKKSYIFHNDPITFHSIQSMILRLIEEVQSDKFGRTPQLNLCVNDLILHLNRIVYERNHPKTASEILSLYEQVHKFIEEHLDENLSLDQLSLEFYVSKYHIAHIFKDNIGISIHQYITKKRLAASKEAILSNIPITDAFQMFGFGDYSSFYRAFKKEYGVSPKDFKDMQMMKWES